MQDLKTINKYIKDIEEIEKASYATNEIVEKLINICEELYFYDLIENIVSYDMLLEIVKNMLNNGDDLERLYYFLPSDKDGNPYAYWNWFIINTYGNADIITIEDIQCIIDKLKEWLKEVV